MSLWSWLRGSPSTQKGDGESPQLVFLMEETLEVGIEFVRGAIKHAFGVTITDGSTGDDYLIGDWPVFNFSVGGFQMQILFVPGPYFEERAHKYVPGDRNAVRKKAQGKDLPVIFDRHRGMITVWLLKPPAAATPDESYARVGKMLAAFDCPDVWAILWPAGSESRVWDPEMVKILAGGSPLKLFQ